MATSSLICTYASSHAQVGFPVCGPKRGPLGYIMLRLCWDISQRNKKRVTVTPCIWYFTYKMPHLYAAPPFKWDFTSLWKRNWTVIENHCQNHSPPFYMLWEYNELFVVRLGDGWPNPGRAAPLILGFTSWQLQLLASGSDYPTWCRGVARPVCFTLQHVAKGLAWLWYELFFFFCIFEMRFS